MAKATLSFIAAAIAMAVMGAMSVRAGEHVDCSQAPRAEWAQCIIEQSGDRDAQ